MLLKHSSRSLFHVSRSERGFVDVNLTRLNAQSDTIKYWMGIGTASDARYIQKMQLSYKPYKVSLKHKNDTTDVR